MLVLHQDNARRWATLYHGAAVHSSPRPLGEHSRLPPCRCSTSAGTLCHIYLCGVAHGSTDDWSTRCAAQRSRVRLPFPPPGIAAGESINLMSSRAARQARSASVAPCVVPPTAQGKQEGEGAKRCAPHRVASRWPCSSSPTGGGVAPPRRLARRGVSAIPRRRRGFELAFVVAVGRAALARSTPASRATRRPQLAQAGALLDRRAEGLAAPIACVLGVCNAFISSLIIAEPCSSALPPEFAVDAAGVRLCLFFLSKPPRAGSRAR